MTPAATALASRSEYHVAPWTLENRERSQQTACSSPGTPPRGLHLAARHDFHPRERSFTTIARLDIARTRQKLEQSRDVTSILINQTVRRIPSRGVRKDTTIGRRSIASRIVRISSDNGRRWESVPGSLTEFSIDPAEANESEMKHGAGRTRGSFFARKKLGETREIFPESI